MAEIEYDAEYLDEVEEDFDDDDSVKDPDFHENDAVAQIDDGDDEEDEETEMNEYESTKFTDFHFVKIVQSVGKCLLEESQTPAMKKKKKAALALVISECVSKHGFEMTEQQARKKLENLKQRVKSKVDRKKTGNLPIVLNAADKLLLKLLDAKENPSITQLQFGAKLGVQMSVAKMGMEMSAHKTSAGTSSQQSSSMTSRGTPLSVKSKSSSLSVPKKSVLSAEKEDILKQRSNKTNVQLELAAKQMQVFAKQEQLLDIQILYYKSKLEKLNTTSN